MRRALRLAARAHGQTSPNPLVGAILVKHGQVIGQGFHRRAGWPHAEIEALQDAERRGMSAQDATLYVTLEPCCTQGRTPPCTEAIIAAGIKRVVAAAIDPNPAHAGHGFELLRTAGVGVTPGILGAESTQLNEAFNHWIVHRTPFVTVKAAMSLDAKIATRAGQSKWITGEEARAYAMKLRHRADAILVGVNTVLADDPALTLRPVPGFKWNARVLRRPRRIVLDSDARTPLSAKLVTDDCAGLTTIVVSRTAPAKRVEALRKRVRVEITPARNSGTDLRWLLRMLGREDVTSLLVEGGGEVNASFLCHRLAHRVAFFYAPKIIGGRNAPNGVAGRGISDLKEAIRLRDVEYRWLGSDLLLSARVEN